MAGDFTTEFEFTVTLAAMLDETVTIDYETVDGTATVADGDYFPSSGTLTFAPKVTSQTASISVLGDTVDEYDETFFATLTSATNAVVSGSAGCYLAQQGAGQAQVLLSRRPVADVLWDPSVPDLDRARLRTALMARDFGVQRIGLGGGRGGRHES